MLFVILPVIPLIGAFALTFKRLRSVNIPFIISAVVLFLEVFGLKNVFSGVPMTYRIPLPGPYTPVFHVDSLSAIMVILAAFLWLAVSIYARSYMKHEGKKERYELCSLLVLSSVLGIFLAGDLITMLLFFELMTITSYFWVIHRWDQEAIKAGYLYLFFSIAGGFLIALGIVLMGGAVNGLPEIGAGFVTPSDSRMFSWSIALFIAGFGIKAGMVPLHLWLPEAHSVAPTPASALLSGMLIKVGAYGLIRVGEMAGIGMQTSSGMTWLGPALTVLGTCTMLVGVFAALFQSNAKRLLAYHSVSQMGYIILGLGIGLCLGPNGSLGITGAIYHIVNHALFKAALFLGVGVIYIHTKETDLYKLGGLRHRFPLTAALMLVAVLGITGAPGLNGYASKTLLHHAVSLAAETGAPWMVWIERLFLLTGVGTAASFSKLYYLIFLGKPTDIKIKENKSPGMHSAMGLLAVMMLAIGFQPKMIANIAVIPAAYGLGLKEAASAFGHISYLNLSDIVGMLITLVLGMFVCWAGLKSGVFHRKPFAKTLLNLKTFAKRVNSAYLRIAAKVNISFTETVGNSVKAVATRLNLKSRKFDQSRDSTICGLNFTGISADAAILIITLAFLIAWYTLINLGIFNPKTYAFLSRGIEKLIP